MLDYYSESYSRNYFGVDSLPIVNFTAMIIHAVIWFQQFTKGEHAIQLGPNLPFTEIGDYFFRNSKGQGS